MDLLKRHLSLTVLVAVLFGQVVALAYQVQRPTERGPVRMVRIWAITLITPFEHVMVHTQGWVHDKWRGYFFLLGIRDENRRLQQENVRLRLEQVRLSQDASQAQRLQALFRFKEQFISETVAAQVIGSSGSEQSRVVYIDKGKQDGIDTDMAVITPTGIVGKVIRVLDHTSQVLEISDQTSGVGAILEKSRLQGILKGMPDGEIMVQYIMGDEHVDAGETVITSGGDRVFPKGMPIGIVKRVDPGPEGFLNIRVAPSARLNRLEEVLVITRIAETDRDMIPEVPRRASEILAQRLPTVQPKVVAPAPNAGTAQGAPVQNTVAPGSAVKPQAGAPGSRPGSSGANLGNLAGTPAAKPGSQKPQVQPVAQGAGAAAPKPKVVNTDSGDQSNPKKPVAAPQPAAPDQAAPDKEPQ
jgi:rod shape-determining protein MreC